MFACVFSLSIPCFAASGVNDAEMQVLKMIQKGTKYNADFYEYYNALRVYFNRDSVAVPQIQADSACADLVELYDLYMREEANEAQFFDSFEKVLMRVGVRIIYNRADSTADLIGVDGSLVMSSLKLKNVDGKRTLSLNTIKQTGQTIWQQPLLYVAVGVAVALAAAAIYRVCVKRERNRF